DRCSQDEERPALSVVQRAISEVVARREDLAFSRVPDDECEVAEEMPRAVDPPGVIGMKDELGIARMERRLATLGADRFDKLLAADEKRIGGYPDPAVEG